MDREEKRFQLFATALLRSGVTMDMALREANEAMELFEKSRPDYQDPENLQATTALAVAIAVRQEREQNRDALKNYFMSGIRLSRYGRESCLVHAPDRDETILRFMPTEADFMAGRVIPLEAPRV